MSAGKFSAIATAGQKNTSTGTIAVIAFLFLVLSGGIVLYFFYGSETGKPQSRESASSRTPATVLSPQAVNATSEALKALRKLDAATQVGVSYVQYGTLLIDGQALVNEALRLLPNTELKNQLKMAMEAYSDGYLAWQITNKQGFLISPASSGMIDSTQLAQRYSLPPSPFSGKNSYGQYVLMVTREDSLTTIWKKARSYIDRASSLLTEQS